MRKGQLFRFKYGNMQHFAMYCNVMFSLGSGFIKCRHFSFFPSFQENEMIIFFCPEQADFVHRPVIFELDDSRCRAGADILDAAVDFYVAVIVQTAQQHFVHAEFRFVMIHMNRIDELVFTVFGIERLQRFNIQVGQEVLVAFDIDAHEWNGRWFNDVRAFDVRQVDPMQYGAPQAAPVAAAPVSAAPVSAAPTPSAAPAVDSAEDLPF